MVLSSGTRALRLVSLLGVVFALCGLLLALYFLMTKLFWNIEAPQGWPTLMVAMLLIGGAVLFSLGVIAEYIGVAVNMAMGKPLYLIVSDSAQGPLGRAAVPEPASRPDAGPDEPGTAAPGPMLRELTVPEPPAAQPSTRT